MRNGDLGFFEMYDIWSCCLPAEVVNLQYFLSRALQIKIESSRPLLVPDGFQAPQKVIVRVGAQCCSHVHLARAGIAVRILDLALGSTLGFLKHGKPQICLDCLHACLTVRFAWIVVRVGKVEIQRCKLVPVAFLASTNSLDTWYYTL
jgi:hypothetical protein